MIKVISSSLQSFKTLTFSPALNVVLAERGVDSTPGHSENSAGKSSILEIIHFLLGSNTDPRSIFKSRTLSAVDFSMQFDLPYGTVTARRSGDSANVTYVEPSNRDFPVAPLSTRRISQSHFTLKIWRRVLAESWFSLSPEGAQSGPTPSFRSLIGYFGRRKRAGGLNRPERQSSEQQLDDIQICLSFLFDLDWRLPAELSVLREREKQLAALRAAARSETFGSVLETVAQLRPKLVASESRLDDLVNRAQQFVVVDEYHEIVREVASLRKRIRDYSTANLIDQELLDQLKFVISNERPADDRLISAMFNELQINLPDAVTKRLEQVKSFHQSVAENRRADLIDNISDLERRIADRLEASRDADSRRSELMKVLSGAGALEDFTFLQQEIASEQQKLSILRNSFENARFIEGQSSTLAGERIALERRIRSDHDLRDAALRRATIIVDQLVKRLYDDRVGKLLVEVTANGPRFEIVIDGDRSEGIASMEIWVLDMMLCRLCGERSIGPGFLVHDSHLLSDVDNRQAALALEIGLEFAQECGFQYIVTMNADQFERLEVSDGVRSSVLQTKLYDNRDSGGLFGVVIEDARNASLRDVAPYSED